MHPLHRSDMIAKLLEERILVLDGAMGTMIQAAGLEAGDFGGEEQNGCNELLVALRPKVIQDIHAAYLEAGADIIETDTFGGTPLVLNEFGVADRARELNRLAASLARGVAADYSTSDKPRFVAGSMGPTTRAISVTGGVTFEQLRHDYREQALGLIEGGADYLLIETMQDARNAKAALLAIHDAAQQLSASPGIALSGTIETMGTTLAGQTPAAMVTSFLHVAPLYLGLNCATGPEQMTDHLRVLSERSTVPTACVPNAGLPDENGDYGEDAGRLASVLGRFLDEGWVNLIGGCCGSSPEHITALAEIARGRSPRRAPAPTDTFCLSGLENLDLTEDNRPVLVGERTNVIGSRKFKNLIKAGDFETAAEIARKQVRGGAQVIDICLAHPDGDELEDMERFLAEVTGRVKVPLMIDTTDPAVMARALTWCQGRAVINSVNLEDGEGKIDEVAPLARRFGAALVVGCIDEDPDAGMARTKERKLAVARRAFDLLTGRHGLRPADIIIDPLVFPCASGDEDYLGAARETLDGLRMIKEALPGVRTILGVSNVSFGLPPAAREVVNSVFLHHATKAGLDLAIVNPQRLERFASIGDEARRLAEHVLFDVDPDAPAKIADHFAGRTPRRKQAPKKRPPAEQLHFCVVDGSREGLIEALDVLLESTPAMDIVNGPLMDAMAEVGRLFNENELIVAEVLQSAAVMKKAVGHLESHIDGDLAASRGTLVLATVKGDVHDIGKNLVDIILSNNGYKVIDLGIKVASGDIVNAVREHDPDFVGLSGLLVRSTNEMKIVAEELSHAGLTPPLLVGGAALSRKFCARKISPVYGGVVAYARDAMQGLGLANRLLDEDSRDQYVQEWDAYRKSLTPNPGRSSGSVTAGKPAPAGRPPVRPAPDIPQPADYERHVERFSLDEVWPHLDLRMLYNRHLGLKGNLKKHIAARDPKTLELMALVERLQETGRRGGIECRGVWQAWEVEAEGDAIVLYRPGSTESAGRFDLPRQNKPGGLCLADYVRTGAGRENLILFVTTAGAGVRQQARKLQDSGDLLESHALQALALQTAEAAAEYLHARLRREWGYPDSSAAVGETSQKPNRRGQRYSFGYSSCPDLEGQRLLCGLLKTEEIGVHLTEGCMMDPEASVSALVFHHPEAEYFVV